MKKLVQLLILSSLISTRSIFAQVQICEIKYSENNLKQSQRNSKANNLISNVPECHQIGTEFNELGKPIKEKPIFACCKAER